MVVSGRLIGWVGVERVSAALVGEGARRPTLGEGETGKRVVLARLR